MRSSCRKHARDCHSLVKRSLEIHQSLSMMGHIFYSNDVIISAVRLLFFQHWSNNSFLINHTSVITFSLATPAADNWVLSRLNSTEDMSFDISLRAREILSAAFLWDGIIPLGTCSLETSSRWQVRLWSALFQKSALFSLSWSRIVGRYDDVVIIHCTSVRTDDFK